MSWEDKPVDNLNYTGQKVENGIHFVDDVDDGNGDYCLVLPREYVDILWVYWEMYLNLLGLQRLCLRGA
jgi:hypothetical protein